MKKVSIITVSYNSVATIRDTIESVLSQRYPNIEYIVVDGGSTDGTMSVVEEYREKIDVILSEPDEGIYDAMNKGIALASGEFIGMLNSDDIYSEHDVIENVVGHLSSSGADCLYADLEIVDRHNLQNTIRLYSSKGFSPSQFRWGWMFPHPTFFVKRKCYEKYGIYKSGYRVAADFELLVRFLSKERITYIRMPKCIVKMRHGGVSSSGFWSRILQNFEVVRACRENGVYTNIFFVALKVPLKLWEYRYFGRKVWSSNH